MTAVADAGDQVDAPPAPRGVDWRLFVVPVAIYALSRLVQLWLIAWLLPDDGDRTVSERLLAWDSGHFRSIVENGYPQGYSYAGNGELDGNALAFFPGYPMLARGLYLIGFSSDAALLTVSWVAGAAAVVLVYALGARLYNHGAGVALAALFCLQPMSVVLSMGYSEGLFVAFVAGMLLAAHRRAWLVAGVLGLCAALTRPTGVAAALALVVAAGLALRDRDPHRWRAVAGAVLALAGAPAYLLWVGLRVGEIDAWFNIQTAGWGTASDFGQSAVIFVRDALRGGEGWVHISVAWILIAAVVAAVVALTRRVWAPLTVYGLIALTLVLIQSGYYHSKPRLLVPVLLVLVPAAVALGRARTSTRIAVLAGYGFFGLWYGAYLLTIWRYAI